MIDSLTFLPGKYQTNNITDEKKKPTTEDKQTQTLDVFFVVVG